MSNGIRLYYWNHLLPSVASYMLVPLVFRKLLTLFSVSRFADCPEIRHDRLNSEGYHLREHSRISGSWRSSHQSPGCQEDLRDERFWKRVYLRVDLQRTHRRTHPENGERNGCNASAGDNVREHQRTSGRHSSSRTSAETADAEEDANRPRRTGHVWRTLPVPQVR